MLCKMPPSLLPPPLQEASPDCLGLLFPYSGSLRNTSAEWLEQVLFIYQSYLVRSQLSEAGAEGTSKHFLNFNGMKLGVLAN